MTQPSHNQLGRVAEVCAEPAELLALSIIRFLATGYSTGDVACWDSAFAGAEQVLGAETGGRLVAGLTGLVRAIRAERIGGWMFMPVTCCRVTDDETAILRLLAAARARDDRSVGDAAARLAGRPSAPLIEAAAEIGAGVVEEAAASLPADIRSNAAQRLH